MDEPNLNGINLRQFRVDIVRPVLTYLGLHSQAAENLLIGTALTESRLHYVRQLNSGPALSVFQIEPATFHDLYSSFLAYRPELLSQVDALCGKLYPADLKHMELIGNLSYATAIARVFYRRVKAALPAAEDAAGMANYWKRHYNTIKGAGTVSGALPHFQMAVTSA